MRQFIDKARDSGMRLIESDGERLAKLAGGHGHQGVVAMVAPMPQNHSLDDLLDTVEGRLAEEEVDDLLRADLVATAVVDGTPMHLVGEVSCTADSDDVVRASRRAGHLRKAGLLAMPFVACEAIGPKTLELASREQVRVLVEGRLLPEAV
jgi:hypothetical protein